jgi:tight adherence protein B
MLIAVLVALLLIAGMPWWVALAGLVAAAHPIAALVAIGCWALVAAIRRSRAARVAPDAEARLFRAISAELRAGASLRSAIVDATAAVPGIDLRAAARRCEVGGSVDEIAERLAAALPANGRVAAPAVRLAGTTGGRAAALFDILSERATHQGELQRERGTLTAQARLSAVVVGLAPLGFAGLLLASGRASVLLDHGTAGVAIMVVGLGLEVSGLVVVALLLRRADGLARA